MENILLSKFSSRESSLVPYNKEYYLDDEHIFYVEPIFYTQLEGVINIHHNAFGDIINEIEKLVKKNKKVVFAGDYENPYIKLDDFIYVEIIDILDNLGIYIEDKSRGSDYGD